MAFLPIAIGQRAQILRSNQAPKEIKFGRFIRRIPSDHYPVLVKIEFAPMKK